VRAGARHRLGPSTASQGIHTDDTQQTELICTHIDQDSTACRPSVLGSVVVQADSEAGTIRHAVRVIELTGASWSTAVRAGDAVGVGFPRLFLDAHVVPLGGAPALFGNASPRGGSVRR
jgi:hypothetical protein